MKIINLIIMTFVTGGLWAQYQGPLPPISSGYGSDGSLTVEVINISNDHYILKDISIFYPQNTTSALPTIFFSHGYGGNDTTQYIETLRHIASKGYVVVFVPYKTIGATIPERYQTLYDGFTKAARDLTTIIDTTRVGFYGHSFGGGATPRIAFREFTENNWGENGRFIFCSAPWYSYELGATNLADFPTDCKMISVFYNDDTINDHRMGMDVFNNIAIDDSIKDCLIVYSDTISDYIYEANHNLPGQAGNGEFDALDYYVSFRLLDALSDYTFTGNKTAKDIALGNASPAQIDMGNELSPLFSTNNPSPSYLQSNYLFPCDSSINERNSFCQSVLSTDEKYDKNTEWQLYPNPANGLLRISFLKDYEEFQISIYNFTGQKMYSEENQKTIHIGQLPAGTYFVSLTIDGTRHVKLLVKY